MNRSDQLLNLYNQYKDGQIGITTVKAKFDVMVQWDAYELYRKENEGKWECYNSSHCCNQCCDCGFDIDGKPIGDNFDK